MAELRKAGIARSARADSALEDAEPTGELGWKEQVLDNLMEMAPDAFERLARRLLREADFDSVSVTGKSGDGGIDGLGVYRLGLVSFWFSSSASATAAVSGQEQCATSAAP